MTEQLRHALAYLKAGYNVIPIMSDGSKAPSIIWSDYQQRRTTEKEVHKWFADGSKLGIGIVCGAISRNLEVLDFDSADTFAAFVAKVGSKAIAGLPQVRTPAGGTHLYLHRDFPPIGNRKLANRLVSAPGEKPIKVKVLVETRGEGGQVLAPGTPMHCHPSGKTYTWINVPEGVSL